jgi:hypothetical protein
MEIDKVFNNDVDGVADNLFSAVKNSVSEIKAMQQRKAAENVQLVIHALKKLETELRETNEDVANQLALRIASIKDGRDGKDGKNGKDGRDGKTGLNGKDGNKGDKGLDGRDGRDGVDGISVVNANIDFDGSLIITLSDGQELNVGEVVAPDLAERIKIISTMSTNGAIAVKEEGTTITSGVKSFNFVGSNITATTSGDDVTVTVALSGNQIISVTDNTNAALRITQLGSGNALLVEDSTNPDSTPVAIDASGNVLVGITTAQTISGITPAYQQLGANNYAGMWTGRYSANNSANFIYLSKSRSSTVGTNTIVQSGDDLGTIAFYGADGTDLIHAASIFAEVDGTPGTNDMPGRLVFSTTADGASSPTERLKIANTGQHTFTIADMTATNPSAVTYSITAKAAQTGTTSSVIATYNTDATYTGAGSIIGFYANQGTFTVAPTNQYGFYYSAGNSGATNNYAFWSGLASGVGEYNLYMTGTADNYLNGYTYIKNVLWQYAPTPTSKAAAATLTAAELQTGILNTTGTTYTITLPTGTAIDTGFTNIAFTDVGFDWYVVNTASGIVTIAVGASGMTSLGTLTIATGVSAHFRFRRTAANTYVLYRLG